MRATRPTSRSLGVLLLAAALAACSDIVSDEEPGELSRAVIPPETSKDSVMLGDMLYACDKWSSGTRPVGDRIWTDVYFYNSEGRPEGRPDSAQLAPLEAVGATFIHVFNFPVVRADIPIDSVPGLYERDTFNHVGLCRIAIGSM